MNGLLDPDFIMGALFGAAVWSLALMMMGKWPWPRTSNQDSVREGE